MIVGLDDAKREVLNTRVLDAAPDHRYELAGDSIWPLVLALAAGGTFFGVIFNPWAVPIGAFATFVALALWFWRDNEPRWIKREKPAKVLPPRVVTPLCYDVKGQQ